MQVELSAKELSLLQCAIVHAELFWKPSYGKGRQFQFAPQFVPNSPDVADLLEKISLKVLEAIDDEHRTKGLPETSVPAT